MFDELEPDELERLAILSEECGEVIQVIGKILRHGYHSTNPTKDDDTDNRTLLEMELGHVKHAVDRMVEGSDVERRSIQAYSRLKKSRIRQYLHHQD